MHPPLSPAPVPPALPGFLSKNPKGYRGINQQCLLLISSRRSCCCSFFCSSCGLCPGVPEGGGQAAAGETLAPEAELGCRHAAEEIPTPPSPPAAPCPPGEGHAHPGSFPRLPGQVRGHRPAKGQPGGDGQAPPHVGSWPATLVFVWLVHPSSENSFLFSSSRKRYRRLKKTLVQFKTMILISRPLIQRRKRCQVTTVLSEQGEAISALSRASCGLGEARAGMALEGLLGVTQ